MARKDESKQATETLEEIASVFDRSAEWVAENPQLVLSVLGAVLLGAGALGFWNHATQQRRLAAAEAVGLVQAEYLKAMGASPLSAQFVEPANEETARATRRDFAAQLREAAAAHAGTAAARVGELEAAALLAKAGDAEAAQEIWRATAEEADGRGALDALTLLRQARALEAAGEAAEASRLYERAGRSARYPGALRALGDAARSAADAGERERALALFDEIEARLPGGGDGAGAGNGARAADDGDATPPLPRGARIPAHTLTRLRELRISAEDTREYARAADEPATPAASSAPATINLGDIQVTPVAE